VGLEPQVDLICGSRFASCSLTVTDTLILSMVITFAKLLEVGGEGEKTIDECERMVSFKFGRRRFLIRGFRSLISMSFFMN
jgi:hypothetical protein